MTALLEIEGLHVAFPTAAGVAFAVAGVSFAVRAGECVGIVGESGSGKSMTCRAILGLVPRPGPTIATIASTSTMNGIAIVRSTRRIVVESSKPR